METYFYNGLNSEGFLDDNNWGSSVGNYIYCPEYLQVTLDTDDKILEDIKTDGTHEFMAPVSFGGNIYYVSQNPEWIRVITDEEGKIIAGIKPNGSTYIAELEGIDIDSIKQEIQEYIESITDNIKDITDTFQYIDDIENRTEIKTDHDNRIISYRDEKGILHDNGGIFTKSLDTEQLNLSENARKIFIDSLGLQTRGNWVNEYPAIFNEMSIKDKLLNRNDDITILIVGDSLSAFHNQAPFSDQNIRPCQMSCKNWIQDTWDYINDVKIDADRFDSTKNPFIESGSFSDDPQPFYEGLPYWTQDAMLGANNSQNGSITRYSDSPNASISFNWDLDSYEKMHFIHRLDYRGAENVTLTIQEGNGYIEVFDETNDSWVEANGFIFSQKIEQLPVGSGYAWTLANWRMKFRKAANASGIIHITMTKGNDNGYFMYWGVEKWNGNRIIIVNSSRGGRECIYFQDVVKNDIIGRKPDLLIFQLVLINEYDEEMLPNNSHLAEVVVNHFQDFLIGNRIGHENQNSIKNLSNNFEYFQMITIVPNVRYEFFREDSDSTFKTENLFSQPSYYMDKTAIVTWNLVKKMLLDNNIKFIDINAAEKREALSRGWGFKQAFNSHGMNSIEGFTIDTVHPNVFGSEIWAKHIAPIFDITE